MQPRLEVVQSIPCYVDNETSPIGIANILFCGRCVRDRFNVLNQYSDINWVDTVDKVVAPSSIPIADIMDQRAVELIKQGSIATQWSGGVDSTSLLLALIKNGISKEDLVVFYDANSVAEYPKLYEWLKEQGWNLKEVKRSWLKELGNVDTDLITNGWCADQLFGSIYFHEYPSSYSLPLVQFLENNKFPQKQPSTEEINKAVEVYREYANKVFGIELNIAAELGWFINFTCKWTWVSTFNELYLSTTKNSNKTQVFYNTEAFQAFALNNFENIARDNIYAQDASKYKEPLKQYCYSVFKDDDYLQNKTKNPSWNSSSDRTMVTGFTITAKTSQGIERYLAPEGFPMGMYQDALEGIFTRFKK